MLDTNRSAQDNSVPLPEQRVGAALRDARRAAGLSLRAMAKHLNYGSHSTLSEYENGARMPSETVTEGYERVLHLPPGTLMSMLEEANIERHGDAWAKRRIHVPLQFPQVQFPQVQFPQARFPPADEQVSNGHGWTHARSVRLGASVLSAIGPGAVPASPFPEQPVADGSDPDAAGCSPDAITVHARRLALTKTRTVVGHIELRYCARAKAAWGRFEGYHSLDHLATGDSEVHIVIDIERQADATRLTTVEPYCFDFMWGNLLTVDSGAFRASASVLIADEAVATGETDVYVLDQ